RSGRGDLGGGQSRAERLLLLCDELRVPVPAGCDFVLVNEGGYGFYRVRHAPELLDRLFAQLGQLSPIERFNLVGDAWAATQAGLMPLREYRDPTARFRGARDKNG